MSAEHLAYMPENSNMSSKDRVQAGTAPRPSSFSYVCRLCLGCNDQCMSAISALAGKIAFVTKLDVSARDGLPAFICSQCVYELNMANVFIHRSITSNTLLRSKQSELQDVSAPTTEVAVRPVEVARTLKTSRNGDIGGGRQLGRKKSAEATRATEEIISLVVKPEYVESSARRANEKSSEETDSAHESVDAADEEIFPDITPDLPSSPRPIGDAYENVAFLPPFPAVYCLEPPACGFEPKTPKKSLCIPKISSVKISRPKFFTCDLCDTSFCLKKFFNLHMQSHKKFEPSRSFVHGNSVAAKPHKANAKADRIGEKSIGQYSRPKSLAKGRGADIKKNTGKKPKLKLFTCNLCDESFSLMTYFNLHMRSHTKFECLEPRAFPCARCGQKFARKKDMLKHAHSHTKTLPYKCSKCGDKFAKKVCLTLHVRVLHSNQLESIPFTEVPFRSLQLRLTKIDSHVASGEKNLLGEMS